MLIAAFVCLAVLDLGLLAVIVARRRERIDGEELLAEITRERQMFQELATSLREEIDSAHTSSRQALLQVQTLAAEIEQDAKGSKEVITQNVKDVYTEMSTQIEKPLADLSVRQNSLELLLRKVTSERKILVALLARGEKLCKFFDGQLPYDEILKEIEMKKYTDARNLLAQGIGYQQVASDLGLSMSEVALLHQAP